MGFVLVMEAGVGLGVVKKDDGTIEIQEQLRWKDIRLRKLEPKGIAMGEAFEAVFDTAEERDAFCETLEHRKEAHSLERTKTKLKLSKK